MVYLLKMVIFQFAMLNNHMVNMLMGHLLFLGRQYHGCRIQPPRTGSHGPIKKRCFTVLKNGDFYSYVKWPEGTMRKLQHSNYEVRWIAIKINWKTSLNGPSCLSQPQWNSRGIPPKKTISHWPFQWITLWEFNSSLLNITIDIYRNSWCSH